MVKPPVRLAAVQGGVRGCPVNKDVPNCRLFRRFMRILVLFWPVVQIDERFARFPFFDQKPLQTGFKSLAGLNPIKDRCTPRICPLFFGPNTQSLTLNVMLCFSYAPRVPQHPVQLQSQAHV